MTDARSPYRIGAVLIAISALLHFAAPVLSGFSGQGPFMALVGVFYLVAAWGLMQGWRWLAYVMFVFLMIGSVGALLEIWSLAPVPGWVYASIFVVDWLAVLALFVALWRPKRAALTVGA